VSRCSPFKGQWGSAPSCTPVPTSLIGSSGGLIITAHTSSYLFCSPSSSTYHSHIIKIQKFSCAFSILVWFSKFQIVNPGCPPSQPHAFSARLLLDETFAQPDVFAVVNCPVIVLNVFYSAILMRSLMLLAVAQPIILFGKGQSITTSVTDVFQQLKFDTTNQ